MAVVGPGAQQQIQADIKPSLDGASEYEYVTVLNPLTDDFAVQVAQDVPVNLPFNISRDTSGKTAQITSNERDAAQTYGLSLKNPDFQGRKHIVNTMVIPAGQSINLKGDEAQVAVRQIVNELMQREGHQRLMSDPTLRKEAEDRVIIRRGSIQELMDNNLQTPRNQITEAINKSNEVNQHEKPFAGLTAQGSAQENFSRGTEVDQSANLDQSSPKRVGRPKKTDSQ